MKKIGLIIFVVALLVGVVFANFFSWGKASGKFFNVSVDFGAAKGSGNIGSEQRDIAGFSKIDASGIFQVEIVAQKDFAVEVEADDNLLQYVKTEVRGDTLEISLEKRVKTSNPLRVRISAPNIDGIEASGVVRVSVADLKNSELAVNTSGASKIKLAGETGVLIVDVSGASNVEAGELSAANANIDASGASQVNVNVSGELVADASGASRISYTGNAKVSKSTSGASSVSQR